MDIEEIKETIRSANIDTEDSLTFIAAVILMSAIQRNTVSRGKLKKFTGFYYKHVDFVIHNLWANGIIKEYRLYFEDSENEQEQFFQFLLCSMAGAGEIVRHAEGQEPPEEKPISWEDYRNSLDMRITCNVGIKMSEHLHHNYQKSIEVSEPQIEPNIETENVVSEFESAKIVVRKNKPYK